MSLARTFRRHFRPKFWPLERTEQLFLPFEGWAFIRYRYCPASTVPLREQCTENSCNMSLAPTFRRHFREQFLPHEKLNLYMHHYLLNDELSHGVGFVKLAAFLFEKNVPTSGAHEWNGQTYRRKDRLV